MILVAAPAIDREGDEGRETGSKGKRGREREGEEERERG